MSIKIVPRDVTTRNVVEMCRRFGRTCYLNYTDVAAGSSETSENFYHTALYGITTPKHSD